ncbi:hypothetical protein M3Y96_00924800 [Aphelenchoides besseyi]|nr:hypothetical protein M3Y96_00924800 [Aphelenchoides besseyi]
MRVGSFAIRTARLARNVRAQRLQHHILNPPSAIALMGNWDRLISNDEIEQLASVSEANTIPEEEDLQFALLQRYKRELEVLDSSLQSYETPGNLCGSLPRFKPNVERIRNSMPTMLNESLLQGDLGAVRFYLSRYHWPPSRRWQSLINEVFYAFIDEIEYTTGTETKKLIEEIQELFWDLSHNERLATLPPSVVLVFAAKILNEQGMDATIKFLQDFEKSFALKSVILHEPGDSVRTARMCQNLIQQAVSSVAVDMDGKSKVKKLSDLLVQANYLQNSDCLLETIVGHRLNNDEWPNALSFWAEHTTTSYSIAGTDLLLEWVLKDDKNFEQVRQSRIKAVVKTVEKVKSPSAALAECVTAYLSVGRYEDAKVLATYSVIHPTDFVRPIKRFLDKENLAAVELFARLIDDVYFNEMRAKQQNPNRKQKTTNDDIESKTTGVESEKEKTVSKYGDVAFLLTKVYRRRKYMPKQPKIKKYEVNLRQLDSSLNSLFDVWITLAEIEHNIHTLNRMETFVSQNDVALRPLIAKRFASAYETLTMYQKQSET